MLKLQSTLAVAIAATALLSQPSAFAGQTSPAPVTIGNGYAYGSLRSAHDSSDTKQSIACAIQSPAGTSGAIVQCNAQDANGTSITCTDSAPLPTALLIVSGISAATYLTFEWDTNNHCTFYSISNDSIFM